MICVVDIDECSVQTDDCHALATCTNTIGSFLCKCPPGLVGDGIQCKGKIHKTVIIFITICLSWLVATRSNVDNYISRFS